MEEIMPNEIQSRVLRRSSDFLRKFDFDDNKVSSVSEYAKVIQSFCCGGSSLFRGEPHLYDVPLMPSILRDDANLTYENDRHISEEELLAIEQCKQQALQGNIKDKYLRAFIPNMHLEDVNWLPLARHFGFNTRLLDVTSNPLVALYFAVSEDYRGAIPEEDDAFVYIMRKNNFRPVNDRNIMQNSSNDYPPIPISYLELYGVDTEFDADLDEIPYLYEPHIPQERLIAQGGSFVFWRSPTPVLHADSMIPIRINAAETMHIRNELTAFGIWEELLFPC